MVEDVIDQLNKMKDAKVKYEVVVVKKDWQQVMLWVEQVWQYQVKVVDFGLCVKIYFEQNGGKIVIVKFKVDKEGVYLYYCMEFCFVLYFEMQGYLLVKLKGWKPGKVVAEKVIYGEDDYKKQVKKVVDM